MREGKEPLRLRIVVEPVPEEAGGGWKASIPELGDSTFVADGETPESALESLLALVPLLLERLESRGISISPGSLHM